MPWQLSSWWPCNVHLPSTRPGVTDPKLPYNPLLCRAHFRYCPLVPPVVCGGQVRRALYRSIAPLIDVTMAAGENNSTQDGDKCWPITIKGWKCTRQITDIVNLKVGNWKHRILWRFFVLVRALVVVGPDFCLYRGLNSVVKTSYCLTRYIGGPRRGVMDVTENVTSLTLQAEEWTAWVIPTLLTLKVLTYLKPVVNMAPRTAILKMTFSSWMRHLHMYWCGIENA